MRGAGVEPQPFRKVPYALIRVPQRDRRRAGPFGVAWLALLPLWAFGCSSVEVPASLVRPSTLDPALEGVQVPPAPLDDHWTASLGHYLSPSELGRYWLTPSEDRFTRWGDRWLEYSLREELLAPHRDSLSPEELDRVTRQPDYDSSKRELDQILAERAR